MLNQDLHFLGTVADTVPLAKQSFQLLQFHILNFAHLPMQDIALGNQVGLKRFGVITENASGLGQMNLKPCAFGHCIFPWPAETDDRIHDVLFGTGAALVAGFPGMMDQANRDSPAA